VTIPDAPVAQPVPAEVAEYPTELPLRPLAMPSGMLEVTGSTSFFGNNNTMQAAVDSGVDARGGLGKFELAAGGSLHIQSGFLMSTAYRTAKVYGQIGYSLQPMFTGLLRYTKYQPTGGPGSGASEILGLVANKRPLAANVA